MSSAGKDCDNFHKVSMYYKQLGEHGRLADINFCIDLWQSKDNARNDNSKKRWL